jgi:hypothetical protein
MPRPRGGCTCIACIKGQYRADIWKYNMGLLRKKPNPLNLPRATYGKCECTYCIKRRTASVAYQEARRGSRARTRTIADTNFVKGVKYDWDRTTPADYGGTT